MVARRLLVSAVPLVLLASGPLRSDTQTPKVEITMGILIEDSSCARAKYGLVGVCAYYDGSRSPQLYVDFPGGRNVARFLGHDVRLRGTMEFTDCSLPVMHATNVADSALPPPPCPGLCERPPCQP